MLIFRLKLCLGVTSGIGLHALFTKKYICFLLLSSVGALCSSSV